MLLAQAVHFDVRPSTWTFLLGGPVLLLLLGLIVAALYHTYRWLQGERGASNPIGVLLFAIPALLGVAFVAALAVYFLSMTQSPPDVQWAYGPYPEGVEVRHPQTLDELFDTQTQPKIVLEESEPADTEEPAKANRQEKGKPLPKEKPAWVVNPPQRSGQTKQRVLSSGPYRTSNECYENIGRDLQVAVRQRLQQLVRNKHGDFGTKISSSEYYFRTDTIFEKFCPENGEFIETIESPSVGEMKVLHVLLEFSPEEDAYLLDFWQRSERRSRIFGVVAFTGFLLSSIALGWGLLWLDTWTRGYYTKRLLVGVPAAIIASVGVIAMLS